ncbi:hypothetical protein LQF12_07180 [Ruania suaedae]|uniref:hypothetical protein n=1 Tax=Ruania suaedae TaxID=2897774 RepID=UPI001E349E80|nr:hypothetical protein [Ruania suaedae]UFU04355.1 hypothetical protein LQF12_07180 [Ruania suaedae]
MDLETAADDAQIRVDQSGTITVNQDDLQLTVNQDSTWEISEGPSHSDEVSSSWASLCAGYFANLLVNAENDLQWGAQQVCDDASTWPHRVDVELRQGGTGFFDPQILKHSSTGSWAYSRIANNFNYDQCPNSVDHRTRVRAQPWANDVQFPWITSDEIVIGCNTR